MLARLVGVWVLERAEDAVMHPHGLLLVTADGWFALQVGDKIACAGRCGIDAERFLVDPVVARSVHDVGRIQQWRWSFDRDVLTLATPDAELRWRREGVEVVTGIGEE